MAPGPHKKFSLVGVEQAIYPYIAWYTSIRENISCGWLGLIS